MDKIIRFVLKHLNICSFDELCWKWQVCLDYFFYFAKCNGSQVPSIDDVRRYL